MKFNQLIKIIFLLLVCQIKWVYADASFSNLHGEAKYRIEQLENKDTEFQRRVEKLEENSQSIKKFESIFELNEKIMAANSRHMDILIGLFSIVLIIVPIVGFFWNNKFIKEAEKNLNNIKNNMEKTMDEVNKQIKVISELSKSEKAKERNEIAQKGYSVPISSTQYQKNNIDEAYEGSSLHEESLNTTNPKDIEESTKVSKAYDEMNKARLFSQKGKISEAISKYDEIINKYRESVDNPDIARHIANAYFNKGVLLADQGCFDDAVKEYDEVINSLDDDISGDVKFSRVKSFINKLSILLTTHKYQEAIEGYEDFISKYESDDDKDIKLAVVRAYYNYMIGLWNYNKDNIDKFIDSAHKVNDKYQNEKDPFDIQIFLSRIKNLLIFVLGEKSRLDESISEFRNFILQFQREINPNIILEIEKSFNDQIDLFAGMRSFNRVNEMCNLVINYLQNNPKFGSLVERAKQIKEQIKP